MVMQQAVQYNIICLLEDGTPLKNSEDTFVKEKVVAFQTAYILKALETLEIQKQEAVYEALLKK